MRGIHRSPVNSPHKGQWRGALMVSLICAWINGWVNNPEAGGLRRRRAHYDVMVMLILNILRPGPNEDNISRCIFLKEHFVFNQNLRGRFSVKEHLAIVLFDSGNSLAFYKLLAEPVIIPFADAYMRQRGAILHWLILIPAGIDNYTHCKVSNEMTLIPKHQRCNCCRLGIKRSFHPTTNWACD